MGSTKYVGSTAAPWGDSRSFTPFRDLTSAGVKHILRSDSMATLPDTEPRNRVNDHRDVLDRPTVRRLCIRGLLLKGFWREEYRMDDWPPHKDRAGQPSDKHSRQGDYYPSFITGVSWSLLTVRKQRCMPCIFPRHKFSFSVLFQVAARGPLLQIWTIHQRTQFLPLVIGLGIHTFSMYKTVDTCMVVYVHSCMHT